MPPFASFKTHFPLSSDGFSIVVEYVPTTLLDASATDETMSAPMTAAASMNPLLNLIGYLLSK